MRIKGQERKSYKNRIKSSSFIMLNQTLYNAILVTPMNSRTRRVIDLVIRLTYGCHKKFVSLKHCDLQIVGIGQNHAEEALQDALNKKYLIFDQHTKTYEINEEYFLLVELNKHPDRLKRLAELIGKQLNKQSTDIPEKGTSSILRSEQIDSQTGNIKSSKNNSQSVENEIENGLPKDNLKISQNADHNTFEIINPKYFIPKNEAESYAMELWKRFEGKIPPTFQRFYLPICTRFPLETIRKIAEEAQNSPIDNDDKGKQFRLLMAVLIEKENQHAAFS